MSKKMKILTVVAGSIFFAAAMEVRESFDSIWIRSAIAGVGGIGLGIAIVFARGKCQANTGDMDSKQ